MRKDFGYVEKISNFAPLILKGKEVKNKIIKELK